MIIFSFGGDFYFTFVTALFVDFKKHIDTQFPFLKEKKLMIAVSGGIDSVVLSYLFHRLKFDISLAHCNFRLRGKVSDEDQLFVKDLASQMNMPFFTIAFDTSAYATEKSCSIQMAARELRYDWFKKIQVENNLDYIVTAHHLDDNLETFLINFTRGTGLNGLTGIPPINGSIIRPLLAFTREEVEQYAHDNAIIWREDESNVETKYKRNKIRHQIIPLLKELNPQLLSSFKKTTEYLKGSQHIINHTLESIQKNVVIPTEAGVQKIDIEKLKELKNPKAFLFELLKEFGFTEWNDVVGLLSAQSGKMIWSQTHRLIKDRDHFLLEPKMPQNKTTSFLIHSERETLTLQNFTLRLSKIEIPKFGEIESTILVDAAMLQFPLELRKRKAGDYFYPFGMTGKKKISKFFKDEKLSLIDKENTWLLCSKNEVIWVVNQRLDDRFKVTDNTKNTILIEYIKS